MNQAQTQAQVTTDQKTDVLYYSIIFPDQYHCILSDVQKTILGNVTNSSQGLFVKNDDDMHFSVLFSRDVDPEDIVHIGERYQKLIKELRKNDIFMVFNNIFYKINDGFHITTLYVGGKTNESCAIMEKNLNREIIIQFDKIAISTDFITIGVSDFDHPYFGNPIRHITVGLSKSGKKIFPKDSPTAFEKGTVHNISVKASGFSTKLTK